MITQKLSEIELDVKYNIYLEQKRLKAIKTIKELLDQIDFSVEVVPFGDIKKLSKLLVSLKGKALDEEENRLIEKIVKS
jgi:pantothenate synthetase